VEVADRCLPVGLRDQHIVNEFFAKRNLAVASSGLLEGRNEGVIDAVFFREAL
jgi:hypothetical protein